MLTPQEVSTHAFPKALMNGYNMASVDEFLDQLTDDYTALYKENTALKAKLKVLVEKVEDYRATEDAMRSTLLTAQKMADSIIKEAEAKRDELMAKAEDGARDMLSHRRQELEEADERLRMGQARLAQFIADSKAICAQELQYLEQLPTVPLTATAPAAEPAEAKAAGIEEQVMAAIAAEDRAMQEEKQAEEAPALTEEEIPPIGDPFADARPAPAEEPGELEATRRVDLSETRKVNLEELKFGRNYGSADV